MELREALLQIAEIRRHMAKSDVFRGYRSAPVAVSGLLALGAAALQSRFIPEPYEAPNEYLALWIGTAGLSMAAVQDSASTGLPVHRGFGAAVAGQLGAVARLVANPV